MGKNQGLIITLIIFIILALALGVVVYFTAQVYKETQLQMTQATERGSKAESDIRSLNDNTDKLKTKVGYPTLEVSQILQEMDNDIKSSLADATNSPKTYKDAVAELGRNLSVKNDEIDRYKNQSEEYRVLAENEVLKSRTQLTGFNEQRKIADEAFAKQKGEDSKKINDLELNLEEQKKKTVQVELAAKNLNEKYRTEAADAKEVTDAITGINAGLRNRLDQMNKADFDVPDGNILYVNQDTMTVRLNIGKAEGVRPLTCFGVYPKNTLELGRIDFKGAVQVVRVIDEHESEARIIDDTMNDPIMPGDIIYTPLWKTGESITYALTYGLDVNGSGRNDPELLKNLIESAGGEVAYWVDNEGNAHGELSAEITAIITPNNSIYEVLEKQFRGGKMLDANAEEKPKSDQDIAGEHMNSLKAAKGHNIPEIKLSEFLRKVHYRDSSQVNRYQEEGGVSNLSLGNNATPPASTSVIAPIYVPGKAGRPPVSTTPVAPIHGNPKGGSAPSSIGKVSDFYFRKK